MPLPDPEQSSTRPVQSHGNRPQQAHAAAGTRHCPRKTILRPYSTMTAINRSRFARTHLLPLVSSDSPHRSAHRSILEHYRLVYYLIRVHAAQCSLKAALPHFDRPWASFRVTGSDDWMHGTNPLFAGSSWSVSQLRSARRDAVLARRCTRSSRMGGANDHALGPSGRFRKR